MTRSSSTLEQLRPRADWAKSPLLNRKEWKTVRFGDVVDNVNETCDPEKAGLERFIGLEHLEPGSLHVRTWGNVADGVTFNRRCRPGQVLFGKRRAYQRKVAVAEFDAVVSGDIYVLAPKSGRLLPKLLPFVCMSERFFQHAVGTSAGSLSPRTNWNSLASFKFHLPPIDHQQRLSELLWAADTDTQRWREADRTTNELTLGFIEESLAACEKTTPRVTLRSVVSPERPLCYGIVQPGTFVADGTPFIRVCDMEGDSIAVSQLERVSDEVSRQYRRSVVMHGDVLVSIVGTIGRVAVVGPECAGFNIARAVARLAPAPTVRSEFLAFTLRSPTTQRELVGNSFETARKTLNLSALEALTISLPPLDRQDALLDQLCRIRKAADAVQKRAGASGMLAEAIVNHLLAELP
ncbi:MAG: hypothetical protein BroJett001_26450 [Chloroflexota bacterium]|nr:MAG: hypothetical protein BroJett001_26450 [Chloroflexota bacterium]